MNNTVLILDIYDKYKVSSREAILNALNTAISLGKFRGMKVDRYATLPIVTNRSKHTVMSWFNRDFKKIPLIDLCKIAEYLNYNIYTFFDNEAGNDSGIFLIKNEFYNANYCKDGAKIFIKATEMQYTTDKNVVINNLEKYYGNSIEIVEHNSDERIKNICRICECTKTTYRAWFNRSRTNVRIPLIELCKLAYAKELSVFELMTSNI